MFTRVTRALALTALLAGSGAVVAVSAAASPATAPPASSRTVTVTYPTSSVSANVGDTVVVEMTACAASCGYTWKLTAPPSAAVVRYLATSFRDQPRPAGAIGGSQTQSVSFRAVGPGTTSATWGYTPPGTGATPTQSYRLTFSVSSQNVFSNAPKTGAGTTGQAVQAWRIRTGNDGWFDRVVFDERHGVSPYLVQYVPRSVVYPNGGPVRVIGRYFLQVTLYSTTTAGTTAEPSFVSAQLRPRLPRVDQIKQLGETQRAATFVIGTNQQHGFRVLQLSDPYRLVVDVRH